ncbi:MAG: RHS repeat-associated core domain-containing protein, partial [Limisphaera sp.]|nr:RHS repeat-associated core domain-containing protein [Limisphaera sp.]
PASGTYFCAYDGNGNVAALVQAQDATVSGNYEYGPFAEPIRITGPAARANPFRFSTKRTDDTTDLALYEYRAYSPTLGRWMSRDPIGERGKNDLYDFALNDPLNKFDPDGRDTYCPYPYPHSCSDPDTNHWGDPPSLSLGKGCGNYPDIVRAVEVANNAMKQGACAKWFKDHGSFGVNFRVNCHGKCKLVCLLGGTAWTYPGFNRIGLCPENLTRFGPSGIASLLIHEAAHHYCPIIGGEKCANEAQSVCGDYVTN